MSIRCEQAVRASPLATTKNRKDGARNESATAGNDVPGMNAIPPGSETEGDVGSIIIVIATDAPLLPHQLKRLARRASLGLARTGSVSGNGSGDIFLAFSTGNAHVDASPGPNTVETVSNDRISPLFTATVEPPKKRL